MGWGFFRDLASGSCRPYCGLAWARSTRTGNCLERVVSCNLESRGGANTGETSTTRSPVSKELSPIDGTAAASAESASTLTTTLLCPIAITDAGPTKQTYLYDAIFLRTLLRHATKTSAISPRDHFAERSVPMMTLTNWFSRIVYNFTRIITIHASVIIPHIEKQKMICKYLHVVEREKRDVTRLLICGVHARIKLVIPINRMLVCVCLDPYLITANRFFLFFVVDYQDKLVFIYKSVD